MSDKEKTVKDILLDVFCNGLKAQNSADGKEPEKEPEKPAENGKTAKNEDVDKRKLIDEVGGILKGKVDDEVIRTVIGKLEKVAYDKSEAGTADNCKAKNEDEEPKEEPKKDDKPAENEDDDKEEKAENKRAKNSIDVDEVVNKILTAVNGAPQPAYESRADRLEAGNKY